jgi:hypothetical protein
MIDAVRILLSGLIDYAGLFPPAALGMGEAARNYAAYRGGAYAWALGRFVVPAARLEEFERSAAGYLSEADPWRLSALVGGEAEWRAVAEFNARHPGCLIDTAEVKAASADEIAPGPVVTYVEIPLARVELIPAIARAGVRAKARTGGVTAEAIPAAAEVARFITACARAGVGFKATAGLHHPLRSTQALTYEPESARATMHGFLNVFLAAAFARAEMGEDELTGVLAEESPSAFRFDEAGARWKARRLTNEQLASAREKFAIAFGSCSFEEPIEDLQALGLLTR